MASYAQLAPLAAAGALAPVDLPGLVRKIVALERRMTVAIEPGPETTLRADADQLEQVLINLLKNAVEAARATEGGVRVRWTEADRHVEILIEDDGHGVSDTANLFVPFFTTKPDGSGIGLVLSRQIVEAHGGELSLTSRPEGRGALARVRLPLAPPPA